MLLSTTRHRGAPPPRPLSAIPRARSTVCRRPFHLWMEGSLERKEVDALVPSGSRCFCPPLAVELPVQLARSLPSLTLAVPFAKGPCAGRWGDPQREPRSTLHVLRGSSIASQTRGENFSKGEGRERKFWGETFPPPSQCYFIPAEYQRQCVSGAGIDILSSPPFHGCSAVLLHFHGHRTWTYNCIKNPMIGLVFIVSV
jgi:hypothetical protein